MFLEAIFVKDDGSLEIRFPATWGHGLLKLIFS